MESIVRKGEIACNKQFLLFSQCFLLYMALIFHCKCIFKISSVVCSNLDQCIILSSGNGLTRPEGKILEWSKLKAFVDDRIRKNKKKIEISFWEG